MTFKRFRKWYISYSPKVLLLKRKIMAFRYSSGDFQVFGGQRDSDQMTAERQLLLRDSQQLHSLWSQMAGGVGGLPLASHRHRLKSFHNCFVGRDLIEWLLANDKASSRYFEWLSLAQVLRKRLICH